MGVAWGLAALSQVRQFAVAAAAAAAVQGGKASLQQMQARSIVTGSIG
jgi:hypothetical protein